jgi:hypothetical protein
MIRRSIVTAFLIAAFVLPPAAHADVPGNVIMAKAGDDPLFIWDATPAVQTELAKKQDTKASLGDLELAAAQILSDKLRSMKSLQQASVQIVYQKIGAVSPEYGTATFAGIEKLATIHATRAAIEAATSGATSLPPGFTVTIIGTLPPQH